MQTIRITYLETVEHSVSVALDDNLDFTKNDDLDVIYAAIRLGKLARWTDQSSHPIESSDIWVERCEVTVHDEPDIYMGVSDDEYRIVGYSTYITSDWSDEDTQTTA